MLRAYIRTEGDCFVPGGYVAPGGFRLGAWVRAARAASEQGLLTAGQVAELGSVDVCKWGSVPAPRDLAAQVRQLKEQQGELADLQQAIDKLPDHGIMLLAGEAPLSKIGVAASRSALARSKPASPQPAAAPSTPAAPVPVAADGGGMGVAVAPKPAAVGAAKPVLGVVLMLEETECANCSAAAAQKRKALEYLKTQLPFALVEWPAVHTKPCPIWSHNQRTEQHDTTTTHALVLDAFVRHASEDVLVVFEYEALAHAPQMQKTADYVRNMTTDLLSMGNCDTGWTNPAECMHAYAATKHGAQLLLRQLDHCGDPLAQQVSRMQGLSWATLAAVPSSAAPDTLIAAAPKDEMQHPTPAALVVLLRASRRLEPAMPSPRPPPALPSRRPRARSRDEDPPAAAGNLRLLPLLPLRLLPRLRQEEPRRAGRQAHRGRPGGCGRQQGAQGRASGCRLPACSGRPALRPAVCRKCRRRRDPR